eukprot:TRINITY_DN36844_c0_g2_i1.p1 TRINITY_DN36844_c0_g2~~TRINITY_DN36844_c0_g2_i1.p1  ORF type:complete len:1180 (+),score=310.50 TRINITY_DN36844_c0_g2_i1:217-3756(+)
MAEDSDSGSECPVPRCEADMPMGGMHMDMEEDAAMESMPPQRPVDAAAEDHFGGLTLSKPPPQGHDNHDEDTDDEEIQAAAVQALRIPSGGPPSLEESKAISAHHDPVAAGDHADHARGLISRDLMEEITHDAPTPPLDGYLTPSGHGTRTPSPRQSPEPTYQYLDNRGHSNPGLMSVDHWDWKTDAPEFVPGRPLAVVEKPEPPPAPQQIQQRLPMMMQGSGHHHHGGCGQQGSWAMAAPMPSGGCMGSVNDPGQEATDSVQITQLRQKLEWELRTKREELQALHRRMNQLKSEAQGVQAAWDIEKMELLQKLSSFRTVLESWGTPVDEDGKFVAPAKMSAMGATATLTPTSSWQQGKGASSGKAAGKGKGLNGATSADGYMASMDDGSYDDWNWYGWYGWDGSDGWGEQQASYPSQSPPQQQPSPPAWRGSTVGMGMTQPSPMSTPQKSVTGTGTGKPPSKTADLFASLASAHSAATAASAERRDGGDGKIAKKLMQLNNLITESAPSESRRSSDADREAKGDGSGFSSGAIASTLRAMFPHATIRTREVPDEEGERSQASREPEERRHSKEARLFEERLAGLERATKGKLDTRARNLLQALPGKDFPTVVKEVEDYMRGGQWRDLSSIVRSVCRDYDRRSGKVFDDATTSGKTSSLAAGERRKGEERKEGGGFAELLAGLDRQADRSRNLQKDGKDKETVKGRDRGSMETPEKTKADGVSRSRRARQQDDEDDVFESRASNSQTERSDSEGGLELRDRTLSTGTDQSTPSRRSWADLSDNEINEDEEEEGEHWVWKRVERAARRGFELRRRGPDSWDLRISMAALSPALTEAGMKRYCKWLRNRLAAFKEEHGTEPLRRCRGEIDFSHNSLTNQMVWMLLEALATYEVQTALLKLFANNISQGGVLAICEFLRMNHKAEPVQELHLSHNDIDDESALELLKTLHQLRPKYPPRRLGDGNGDRAAPVWLRMNQNRIQEPDEVRKAAEAEGVTICMAKDRHSCGTSRCHRRECPLVHLYSFNMQTKRKKDPSESPSLESAPSPMSVKFPEKSEKSEKAEKADKGKKNKKDKKDKEKIWVQVEKPAAQKAPLPEASDDQDQGDEPDRQVSTAALDEEEREEAETPAAADVAAEASDASACAAAAAEAAAGRAAEAAADAAIQDAVAEAVAEEPHAKPED